MDRQPHLTTFAASQSVWPELDWMDRQPHGSIMRVFRGRGLVFGRTMELLRRQAFMRRIVFLAALFVLGTLVSTGHAQVSFRQGSAALAIPPFGGYTPGAGMTIGSRPGGGVAVRQGSAALAIPPFGGYDPNAGITIGRRPVAAALRGQAIGAPDPNSATGAAATAAPLAGDGCNRGGTAAGGAGASGSLPAAASAVVDSGVASPASVQIDQLRQARSARAIDQLIAKAEAARASGKSGVAAMYYRMALKRASGTQKTDLESRLAGLTSQINSP